MSTNVETVQDLEAASVASALGTNAAAIAAMRTLNTRRYTIRKAAADAMAADATAETLGCDIFSDGNVAAIYIKTDADVTGSGTNFFTLTISKRDAAGANPVAVGTYTSNTAITSQGSLAEFVRKAFALSVVANARTVVAGGSFNFAITKTGAGVVVPISEIAIDVVPA